MQHPNRKILIQIEAKFLICWEQCGKQEVLDGLEAGQIFFVVKQDDGQKPLIKDREVAVTLPPIKNEELGITLIPKAAIVALQVNEGVTIDALCNQGALSDQVLARTYWHHIRTGYDKGRITADMPIKIKDPDFGVFPEIDS